MDEIVKAALAKWPNVPHCFGWLALDARGNWRMRDERAQALHLPGDRIDNSALVAFINRNYQHDEQGCWFFQNGPQRVYVTLETTPFVARTSPDHGLILHSGSALNKVEHVYMTSVGQIIFQTGTTIAQLDDRDLASLIQHLQIDGVPASDEAVLTWLADPTDPPQAMYMVFGPAIPLPLKVQATETADLMRTLGYRQQPHPAA